MSFDVNVYDNVLVDLVAGNFSGTTTMNAMLLVSTYTFNPQDTTATSLSTYELSGSGYARFTSAATFTVAQVNDEIQYQVLTPAVSFASFTTSDWRHIIIFNASSGKVYLDIDTLQSNTQAGTTFTLDPGSDPFIRLLAP